jgi:F-type H+-transporting ATPase subunit b
MRATTLKRAALAAAVTLAHASLAFAGETAGAVPAAGDVGFPQLKQTDTYASQIFWLAACFVLLWVLMSKVALPRVGGTIDARRKIRSDGLEAAGRASAEAESVTKAYEAFLARAQNEAQDILRASSEAAAARTAEGISRFGETAVRRIAEAETSIQNAKREAFTSLADISAEVAADMAARIAGIQVTKADARAAVTGLMKG